MLAPPSNRRPGYSRKAQYGLFFGLLVAIGGIGVGLLLLAASIIDPTGLSAVRGAALDVTTPVAGGGRGIVRTIQTAGTTVGDYFRAGSQNTELRHERDALRRELIATRSAKFENIQLKRLLKISTEDRPPVTSGRIVGSSFASSRRLATLSAGSNDGVAVGQPVRAPDGLVGRILETGRFASRILLVSDRSNVVPVRALRDGTAAISTGRGDGTVELKPLAVGRNPFRPGDIVVTSGTGGIYAPNVPVAYVVRLADDGAIARPLADPATAPFGIVEPIFEPQAAQAEAAPTARPLP